MTDGHSEWTAARDELVKTLTELGFPAEFGEHAASMLGSPKAIRRMAAYLRYEQPTDIETVADELLAICGEIDAWKEKKGSEEANSKYNEVLRYGFDSD